MCAVDSIVIDFLSLFSLLTLIDLSQLTDIGLHALGLVIIYNSSWYPTKLSKSTNLIFHSSTNQFIKKQVQIVYNCINMTQKPRF